MAYGVWKEKEKTDENSGHYVIASSRPPERRPLERRTLGPIQIVGGWVGNPTEKPFRGIKKTFSITKSILDMGIYNLQYLNSPYYDYAIPEHYKTSNYQYIHLLILG